jgi:hypothetical protein
MQTGALRGIEKKVIARTIRLTARRSFPHVFITASSCISLFKFDYRSSFYQLISHIIPKTKEEKKGKDTRKKKLKYVYAWHTKSQTVRHTEIYTQKNSGRMERQRKDRASYITAITKNNSFCPPFWCGITKAHTHTHTRCFFSYSSPSFTSSFFFVTYSLFILYSSIFIWHY